MCNLGHYSVGRRPALKVTVLCDYFELSGPSIHRIVADILSMMIPGAFGVEYHRNICGISIGILFSLRPPDIPSRPNHYVKSALKEVPTST